MHKAEVMKPAVLQGRYMQQENNFHSRRLEHIISRNFLNFANITFHENPFSGSRDGISGQRQSNA
jgi:hypothetical protein